MKIAAFTYTFEIIFFDKRIYFVQSLFLVSMKIILSLEQVAQLALTILGLHVLLISLSWWLWLILFFSPDISMLGYLVNKKIGAYTYNLFHHKLVAAIFIIAGFLLKDTILMAIGLLLYAHSSFDRIMGYGLKFTDSFKHTHLGTLK